MSNEILNVPFLERAAPSSIPSIGEFVMSSKTSGSTFQPLGEKLKDIEAAVETDETVSRSEQQDHVTSSYDAMTNTVTLSAHGSVSFLFFSLSGKASMNISFVKTAEVINVSSTFRRTSDRQVVNTCLLSQLEAGVNPKYANAHVATSLSYGHYLTMNVAYEDTNSTVGSTVTSSGILGAPVGAVMRAIRSAIIGDAGGGSGTRGANAKVDVTFESSNLSMATELNTDAKTSGLKGVELMDWCNARFKESTEGFSQRNGAIVLEMTLTPFSLLTAPNESNDDSGSTLLLRTKEDLEELERLKNLLRLSNDGVVDARRLRARADAGRLRLPPHWKADLSELEKDHLAVFEKITTSGEFLAKLPSAEPKPSKEEVQKEEKIRKEFVPALNELKGRLAKLKARVENYSFWEKLCTDSGILFASSIDEIRAPRSTTEEMLHLVLYAPLLDGVGNAKELLHTTQEVWGSLGPVKRGTSVEALLPAAHVDPNRDGAAPSTLPLDELVNHIRFFFYFDPSIISGGRVRLTLVDTIAFKEVVPKKPRDDTAPTCQLLAFFRGIEKRVPIPSIPTSVNMWKWRQDLAVAFAGKEVAASRAVEGMTYIHNISVQHCLSLVGGARRFKPRPTEGKTIILPSDEVPSFCGCTERNRPEGGHQATGKMQTVIQCTHTADPAAALTSVTVVQSAWNIQKPIPEIPSENEGFEAANAAVYTNMIGSCPAARLQPDGGTSAAFLACQWDSNVGAVATGVELVTASDFSGSDFSRFSPVLNPTCPPMKHLRLRFTFASRPIPSFWSPVPRFEVPVSTVRLVHLKGRVVFGVSGNSGETVTVTALSDVAPASASTLTSFHIRRFVLPGLEDSDAGNMTFTICVQDRTDSSSPLYWTYIPPTVLPEEEKNNDNITWTQRAGSVELHPWRGATIDVAVEPQLFRIIPGAAGGWSFAPFARHSTIIGFLEQPAVINEEKDEEGGTTYRSRSRGEMSLKGLNGLLASNAKPDPQLFQTRFDIVPQ